MLTKNKVNPKSHVRLVRRGSEDPDRIKKRLRVHQRLRALKKKHQSIKRRVIKVLKNRHVKVMRIEKRSQNRRRKKRNKSRTLSITTQWNSRRRKSSSQSGRSIGSETGDAVLEKLLLLSRLISQQCLKKLSLLLMRRLSIKSKLR